MWTAEDDAHGWSERGGESSGLNKGTIKLPAMGGWELAPSFLPSKLKSHRCLLSTLATRGRQKHTKPVTSSTLVLGTYRPQDAGRSLKGPS